MKNQYVIFRQLIYTGTDPIIKDWKKFEGLVLDKYRDISDNGICDYYLIEKTRWKHRSSQTLRYCEQIINLKNIMQRKSYEIEIESK